MGRPIGSSRKKPGNAQKELFDHLQNILPVDGTDRNQSSEMEQHGKEQLLLLHILQSKKMLKKRQMAGTGNRQEFRYALKDSHKYRHKIWHAQLPPFG
ncbi:hypothetical protein SDC9_77458 [bioreactor metagenome]|uniref:Uncharacterized protein n=1 Tax=bioreactor metagenome TaxID=1076179 RepID=A0A644YQN0_9ZZZZ